eukprot:2536785-Amphidinium_carterae.1
MFHVRVSVPLVKQRTMQTPRKTRKTIQDNSSLPRSIYDREDPRCVRLTCRPPGAQEQKEKNELNMHEEPYKDSEQAEHWNRGKLFVTFDMVAELAIWVAERASVLAESIVTRASQLLYYIAWLC